MTTIKSKHIYIYIYLEHRSNTESSYKKKIVYFKHNIDSEKATNKKMKSLLLLNETNATHCHIIIKKWFNVRQMLCM